MLFPFHFVSYRALGKGKETHGTSPIGSRPWRTSRAPRTSLLYDVRNQPVGEAGGRRLLNQLSSKRVLRFGTYRFVSSLRVFTPLHASLPQAIPSKP